MADNRIHALGSSATRTIAGYDARCERVVVGDDTLELWRVDDLERYVDRDALLRGDDPGEPPYWAHCWGGARVLAERVPSRPGRVLEIGCGLGLPGVVAARRGGDVLFLDRVRAPLAFVAATLGTNGLRARGVVVGDALWAPWRGPFDVVLAAEVLYDRAAFRALATALASAVAPSGVVLLADGHRIDTRAFYDEAASVGLAWTTEDVVVHEDGVAGTISIVTMRRVAQPSPYLAIFR